MKMLVCADLHLNNSTYGGIDKDGFSFRTRDFCDAFKYVVDQAIDTVKPDIFVVSGDIYETPHPSNNVREFFLSQVKRLSDAGIRTDLLVGNHDACSLSHALQPVSAAKFPGVYVHDSPSIGSYVAKDGSSTMLLFFPHSLAIERQETSFRDALAEFAKSVSSMVQEARKGKSDVCFFGHFDVNGARMSDLAVNKDRGAVSTEDLNAIGANYVFLGHYHAFQMLETDPSVVAMYVGSLERIKFDDMQGKKGFVVYDPEFDVGSCMPRGLRFVEYPNVRARHVVSGSHDEIVRKLGELGDLDGKIVQITFKGTDEEYRNFCDAKPALQEKLAKAKHVEWDKTIIDPNRDQKVQALKEEIDKSGHLGSTELVSIIDKSVTAGMQEGEDKQGVADLLKDIVNVVDKQQKVVSNSKATRVRLHGARAHCFQRFGETANIVEFDPGASFFIENGLATKKDKGKAGEVREKSKDFMAAVEAAPRKMFSIVGRTDGDERKSNGAGKSSILEAVSYGFFERLVREFIYKDSPNGRSTLSVISEVDGAFKPMAYVDVLFSSEGELWLLHRGRKSNKTGTTHTQVLDLVCLSSDESASQGSFAGHRKDDAETKLAQLLQMDYETFANSVMFGQNDAGQFIRGTDKVKKEILVKILRLSILDAYLAETRDRKRDEEKTMVSMQSFVDALASNVMKPEAIESAKQEIERLAKSIVENDAMIGTVVAEQDKLRKQIADIGMDSIKREIDMQSSVIDARKSELDSKLSGLKEEEARVLARISKLSLSVVSLDREESSINSQMRSCTSVVNGFDEAKNKTDMDLVSKAREAKPARQKEQLELQAGIRSLSEEKGKLRGKVEVLATSIASFKHKVDNAVGICIQCPECESSVTIEHMRGKMDTKSAEKAELEGCLDKVVVHEATLQKNLADVTQRIANIDKYLGMETALVRVAKDFEAAKAKIEQFKTRLESIAKDKAGSASEISSEKEALGKVQAGISGMNAEFEAIMRPLLNKRDEIVVRLQGAAKLQSQLSEELASRDRQIGSIRGVQKVALARQSELQAAIDSSVKNQEKVASKQAEIKQHRRTCEWLRKIEDALGLEGIRTEIIEKYIPLLNSYITEFMDVICAGRMSATVAMDSSTSSGIKLVVSGSSASRAELVSGGEFMRLRLAVDLALGMLSLARNDNAPDFVCLDEILAPVDEDGKDRMFDIVGKLQKYFRTIIVISHDKMIQEHIKNVIVVNKVNDVSRIESQVFAS